MIKEDILWQLDIGWQLFQYHIQDLTDAEVHWCFHEQGLQVRCIHGVWKADWPESEAYSMGNPSIAWTLWHIKYWWTKAINMCYYNKDVEKELVQWSGSCESMKQDITHLHDTWVTLISNENDEQMQCKEKSRWPITQESFTRLACWLNIEFMKNVAEIGSGRFLYASHKK